jgi:ABC-2 type transport system ATP-binding protein
MDATAPTPRAGHIVVRGLARSFGGRPALEPLDLEVGPGVTGLLGPNGSGKSTLLRLLTGLVRPHAGSASVDGVAVEGDGLAVRRRVTYAPGEIALYGDLRAGEHLQWFLRGRDREARARARALADALELPLAKRVHAYSHGMKRQLLFAAALAPRVAVRILDEISEGLDPNKRSVVLDLLAEDAARGTTVLLSSHHLAEVDRACDTFVFLDRGRLVGVERAADLRTRAARLLHLEFAPEALIGARAALDGLRGAQVAAVHESRVTLKLEREDPREALAQLAALPGLPVPRRVQYGELALRDLYRDLYGVEAC